MNSRGLLLAWLLWLPLLAAAAPRDPDAHFFHPTFGDFTEELVQARAQGKNGILLFFEMDTCPFCQRMRETVLNQPEVQDWYREHFLCFSVDVEGDLEVVDFSGATLTQKAFAVKDQQVRATPVIAFFDLDGTRVARYTGATSGVEEFMLLGRYVADGRYAEMPFSRYKRAQRAATR